MATFELQGHRGARGLKPENTLPSFEAALDIGVTSIETDVHLTRDGIPVIYHDERISPRLCRLRRGQTSPGPGTGPLVSSLTLDELRGYRADRNPDRKCFPEQDRAVTPLARWFARQRGLDPYALPTLDDLFRFAEAYAGEPGAAAGKPRKQRSTAALVDFSVELKRVPFRPEVIGDGFDGRRLGLLELRFVEAVVAGNATERIRVRGFDHRSLRVLDELAPEWPREVLIAGTAPVDPAGLAKSAGADTYCPDYRFLDAAQVRACHAGGVRVLPWTVNDEADWLRLLDWGVDGITTDHPDRLAEVLRRRGVAF